MKNSLKEFIKENCPKTQEIINNSKLLSYQEQIDAQAAAIETLMNMVMSDK